MEGRIADDVEGCVVVPVNDVHRLIWVPGVFYKPLEKRVYIVSDQGLLLQHPFGRKVVTEIPTGNTVLPTGVDANNAIWIFRHGGKDLYCSPSPSLR